MWGWPIVVYLFIINSVPSAPVLIDELLQLILAQS